MDDLGVLAQVDVDQAPAEIGTGLHLAAADDVGALVEIDEQLDIARHRGGGAGRIEAEGQRPRHTDLLQPFRDGDGVVGAAGMPEQHDRAAFLAGLVFAGDVVRDRAGFG